MKSNIFWNIVIAMALLCFCTAANAFRSLDFESYTDPDYKGYLPKKIVLLSQQ